MNKKEIIDILNQGYTEELRAEADRIRREHYGNRVFLRGLIEISSFCKNDCYYCGLQSSNKSATRYRLSKDDILNCCKEGYDLGFRTFVLQGGEDLYFNDEITSDIISSIKTKYPDCAITLSLGERDYTSYKSFFDAGADRFLLRHETISPEHYSRLHPNNMTISSRVKCLCNLKEIGFQVGAGIMVGSPYQTIENLAEDLIFLRDFQPHMVGIGPFIPQSQTRYADFDAGSLYQTLTVLCLTRILLPKVLLPSTTALGSIDSNGRELGLKSGCNVVMPNLSPQKNRKNYALYDNKISSGTETVEGLKSLQKTIEESGYEVDMSRGDHVNVPVID